MSKMVGLCDEDGRQREVRTPSNQMFCNQHGWDPHPRIAVYFFGSQEFAPPLQ